MCKWASIKISGCNDVPPVLKRRLEEGPAITLSKANFSLAKESSASAALHLPTTTTTTWKPMTGEMQDSVTSSSLTVLQQALENLDTEAMFSDDLSDDVMESAAKDSNNEEERDESHHYQERDETSYSSLSNTWDSRHSL